MNNKKYWTVILSSGAKSSVKQFKVSKLLLYSSILLIFFLVTTLVGLTYITNSVNAEKEALLVKLVERDEELTEVRQEYDHLKQETITVQRTIEEFRTFEERLRNLDLEIPTDKEPNSSDGSGGMILPVEFDVESNASADLIKIQQELPDLILKFENTLDRLSAYEKELRTIPTILPAAEGKITSKFGNRIDPFNWKMSFHNGIDIAAPLNTSIFAAADGEVIYSGRNGGYGQTITIKHNDTYETLYAHLNHITVELGDKVKKGDVIGGMGTTGRSTGVHLHYEIRRNGEHIDPYLYITFHGKGNR